MGYFTAGPLKMLGNMADQNRFVGQMLKLVGKWPMADCYF